MRVYLDEKEGMEDTNRCGIVTYWLILDGSGMSMGQIRNYLRELGLIFIIIAKKKNNNLLTSKTMRKNNENQTAYNLLPNNLSKIESVILGNI